MPDTPDSRGERIQKVLAAAGLGSRRAIEGWVEAGRIRVNGRIARLGDRATPDDKLTLDERALALPLRRSPPKVILYHKPTGQLVTRLDAASRPTVFESVPPPATGKWVAVGRLDINTSGLLLLTDSGDLANRLMHPKYGVVREYAVRVLGHLSDKDKARLLKSVRLADGPGNFRTLVKAPGGPEGSNQWYRVTIGEGRNREVRRLFAAVGAQVSRLIRTRYGAISLPRDLKPGHWHELPEAQVRGLLAAMLAEDQGATPRDSGGEIC